MPILRVLYKLLVQIHPPAFRRQFAAEMLWIFDEASQSGGALPLCWDGFVSLARQWLFRSGSWKLAVAIIGACLQIAVGAFICATLGRPGGYSVSTNLAMSTLIRLILWSLGPVLLLVLAATLWVKSFTAARWHRL
jgi:hypothetical protein